MNTNIPNYIRPTVSSALGNGFSKIRSNFLVFFLAVLVVGVARMPIDMQSWPDRVNVDEQTEQQNGQVSQDQPAIIDENPDIYRDANNSSSHVNMSFLRSPFYGIFVLAYSILLFPVIKYGSDLIFLQGTRGDEPLKINAIMNGFDRYLNVVLASLLTFGLILIGFIMLIIPGIYVACRLVFVSYLVMDEDMDPVEAVEASWRLTRGHTLKIFLLFLISIPIMIAGFLLMIVGIFPALMWIKSAFASLYLAIIKENYGDDAAEPSQQNEPSRIGSKAFIIVGILLLIGLGFIFHSGSKELEYSDTRTIVENADGLESLTINQRAGSILVTGRDDINEIHVNAVIKAFDENISLALSRNEDNSARLFASPGNKPMFNDKVSYVDLEVEIPDTLNLTITKGPGTSLEVSGIIGNIEIRDQSGNMKVNNIGGNLTIEDGPGNIEIQNISGLVDVRDGPGNIIINEVTGTVTARDQAGNLELNNIQGHISIHDGPGDIIIRNAGNGLTVEANTSGALIINPETIDE